MPFTIIRNDIVNMQVDAIVNTASPAPVIGYGTDAGINKAAGPRLIEARKRVGYIDVGNAAVTPAYDLDARIVIHAVGPEWQDGSRGEAELLRRCYDRALELADENGCESVAFPLLCAGNHGFPKPLALQIAVAAFSEFLTTHDEMMIYLVVFGRETFRLSEKLQRSVESYIDENYIRDRTLDEYGIANKRDIREAELRMLQRRLMFEERSERQNSAGMSMPLPCAAPTQSMAPTGLDELLHETDAGFSETLLKLIDRTGKKDSDIYRRANVDRKLFSKIRNNPNYQPSKPTAVAFAIALELDLDETRDFLGRAGYALSRSSKFDIIIEYFIKNRNYDMYTINQVLFEFDQSLIGA